MNPTSRRRVVKSSSRAALLISQLLLMVIAVTGCRRSVGIGEPDLLFDGGSAVFALGPVADRETYLMVTPLKKLDPESGAICEPHAFELYVVDQEAKGRYVGRRELLRGSDLEKAVLQKLRNTRDQAESSADGSSERARKLIDLIERRTDPPPRIEDWFEDPPGKRRQGKQEEGRFRPRPSPGDSHTGGCGDRSRE